MGIAKPCPRSVQSGATSVKDTDTGGGTKCSSTWAYSDLAGTCGRYSEADDDIETMAKGVAEELAGYDWAETFRCCGEAGRIASHRPFLPRE
ncbi:hypothetical protein ACHMXB_04855 [Arthrobacter sp. UC242_113]|uniref:hypothetical protein n=1 Tax=Arthrobacter sp. UC242_113 TaxID=3374550 RepID=UPI0037574164